MESATPYMALIARNVRAARAAADLSQDGVAARMRNLGFGEWRRQTVGNTERGKRRLAVEELLGLCHVLEATLEQLALPSGNAERPVALPSGKDVVVPTLGNPDFLIWDDDKPTRSASQTLYVAVHADD